MDWVLKRQLWHYDNSLFVITPLVGDEQPSKTELNKASFWIRVYDVPLSCLNVRTAKALASRFESFEEFDDNTDDFVGNDLRFKATIDILKPLLRGVTIGLAGNHLWIHIKYESLPTYCYLCGTIGHMQKQFVVSGPQTFKRLEDIPYGPMIRASPFKRSRSFKDNRGSIDKTVWQDTHSREPDGSSRNLQPIPQSQPPKPLTFHEPEPSKSTKPSISSPSTKCPPLATPKYIPPQNRPPTNQSKAPTITTIQQNNLNSTPFSKTDYALTNPRPSSWSRTASTNLSLLSKVNIALPPPLNDLPPWTYPPVMLSLEKFLKN